MSGGMATLPPAFLPEFDMIRQHGLETWERIAIWQNYDACRRFPC